MEVDFIESSREEDAQCIREKLNQYNNEHVPPDNHARISLLARKNNAIIAGLLGGTYWNWMHVELFWVDEAERKNGLGTRMLRQAERMAIQRGCRNAHLETHDFQSLDFYLHRGYAVFGRLEDLPAGHTKYFLAKALESAR